MYRVKTRNEIEEGKFIETTVGEFDVLYNAKVFCDAVQARMAEAFGYVSTQLEHSAYICEVIETERELTADELREVEESAKEGERIRIYDPSMEWEDGE